MRYPASEKLEIIRLVEESRLSVKRTLEKLGVSRSKFYRWYDTCTGASAWPAWKIAGLRLGGSGTGYRTRSGAR